MTDYEKLMVEAIKRQADILVLDLKRAPERLTQAQRAENISAIAEKLIRD
jgi:hypothetical protein|tara:strand:+ start:145 stop:294 length:150 start_codon:yes stop_codon:yes gene_type:complete